MLSNRVYTLLRVADCGSFIGAAREMHTTQPAVSQQMKQLEAELGITIFDRGHGKLAITRQGTEVVKAARKMVGIYNNLMQDVRDGGSLLTHLTVGVTHTAESNPIAEALARYGSHNSSINIKITTDTINNLYKMLKTYAIDLAVIEGRISDPAVKYMMVDTDYLILAVAPDHPFAKRSMVTLSELQRERMILRLPNSGTRDLFVAHLESNNLSINDFNVILEIDNIATIKDLIRRDFGVSILARSACLDELRKGKIVALPVENLSMMREINIAYREDFTQYEILRGIVQSYNEALRLYR